MSSTGEGQPEDQKVLEPKAQKANQRARARDKESPTKRQRVMHIIRMMRENRYVRHITVAELAEEWGLSEHTVKDDACEAARSFEETDEEKALGKSVWLERVRCGCSRRTRFGCSRQRPSIAA